MVSCLPSSHLCSVIPWEGVKQGLALFTARLGEACPSLAALAGASPSAALCPTAAAPVMYSSQDAPVQLQYNYWSLLHH